MGRSHRPQILHGLLAADLQKAVQLLLVGLAAVPELLEGCRFLLAAPGCGEPGEGHRFTALPGRLPGGTLPQGCKPSGSSEELLSVSGGQCLVLRHTLRRVRQQRRPVAGPAAHRLQQCQGIGRVVKAPVQGAPALGAALQPRFRIRVALDLFIGPPAPAPPGRCRPVRQPSVSASCSLPGSSVS